MGALYVKPARSALFPFAERYHVVLRTVPVAMFNTKRRWMNVLLLCAVSASAEPLRLHPDNPHYFLFRGRPTVLVTSGEHYGAVLNGAFDFRKYVDTLAADNLNLTRAFTGLYREVPGESF